MRCFTLSFAGSQFKFCSSYMLPWVEFLIKTYTFILSNLSFVSYSMVNQRVPGNTNIDNTC